MFQITLTVGEKVSSIDLSYKQKEVRVLKNPEAFKHPNTFISEVAHSIKKAIEDDIHLHIISHSKFVLDLLGELIRLKKINPEDIKISLMNDNNKLLQISCFDNEGYLVNWPVGFMSPDFDIIDTVFK